LRLRYCGKNCINHFLEQPRGICIAKILKIGCSVITGINKTGIYRNMPEKGYAHFTGQLPASACFENVGLFPAVRANEAAHVFHYTERRDINLATEGDTAAHIR
jgi:hypothetical protein